MRDERIEKLAHNLLDYSIGLKKGDHILIEMMGENSIHLGKEIIKQAEIMGAYPHFNIINYSVLREILKNCSEEQIKMYAKHDLQRMQDMDAYVGISANPNTAELNGINKSNLEIYNKYYTKSVHIKERVQNTKWCILRYPTNAMAQMNNMSYEEFEDFYFNVCTYELNFSWQN